MPSYMPFQRFHPYRTPHSLRRGLTNQLAVTEPSTWPYTYGRFIAFGANAEKPPEASTYTGIITISRNILDPFETSFTFRPNGKIYYQFRCSPLVCGNLACRGQTKVLTNFPPPGWDHMQAYHRGSPFDPRIRTPYSGHVFCGFDGDRRIWNEQVWGPGPPNNWGHEVQQAEGQQVGGQQVGVQQVEVQQPGVQQPEGQRAEVQQAVVRDESTQFSAEGMDFSS
ncbi:hypothetical protein PMIN06_004013 [Paraphaeosphaeria minitans]